MWTAGQKSKTKENIWKPELKIQRAWDPYRRGK